MNTVNVYYENKKFQDASVAVMNDIFNSDVSGSSIDDAYKTICRYAKVTKEQFEDMFRQAEVQLDAWKNGGLFAGDSCELSEDKLDMVVGGSFGSFFSSIGNEIANAAKVVGNFVKEHAVEIGIVVGTIALCTGVGAAGFALIGALDAGVLAAGGVGTMAAVGAGVGAGASIYVAPLALSKFGFID